MQGIGLLEVIWKLAEAVIDTKIKYAVEFHDVLNAFWYRKGTETATLKLKLAQKLASVEQAPFFVVLLNLRRLYDTLDIGCLMQTLKGYRAGPRIQGLLEEVWYKQEVVTRQGRFHVPPFHT